MCKITHLDMQITPPTNFWGKLTCFFATIARNSCDFKEKFISLSKQDFS